MSNEKVEESGSGGQTDLLQIAKYFVSWVDDVWGSGALSKNTLAEYERAKLAIQQYEARQVAEHAPLDERAEFEKWCPIKITDEAKAPKSAALVRAYWTAWQARAELRDAGAPSPLSSTKRPTK